MKGRDSERSQPVGQDSLQGRQAPHILIAFCEHAQGAAGCPLESDLRLIVFWPGWLLPGCRIDQHHACTRTSMPRLASQSVRLPFHLKHPLLESQSWVSWLQTPTQEKQARGALHMPRGSLIRCSLTPIYPPKPRVRAQPLQLTPPEAMAHSLACG